MPHSLQSTSPNLKRTIGFWGAVGVMIGVIIGSGIFRTPAQNALELDSPWLILGLWLLGGAICLAGALTYAELAAMFPASGGVYVFIREGFGSVPAFVFGWSYLLLIKPFGAGGIAFVLSEHLAILLDIHGTTEQMEFWHQCSTTIMLVIVTAINWRGVSLSTAFSGVLTAIKFGALAAIVLLALGLGRFHSGGLEPAQTHASKPLVLGIVTVMSSILWTYDGWSDVGAIAGEVKNPQRGLPRIYIIGTLAIVAIYLLVNLAYFMLVPIDEMRAKAAANPSFSVAAESLARLIGPAGATVLAVIVVLSTLGSTHASIMTGARVSFAQARDRLLFRFVGHVDRNWNTPDVSLFLQLALSIAAVWCLGSFKSLADGFVFTMWIFHALAGAAVFVLRAKHPTASRPFRCPGYPIVPALFVLAALGMTGMSIYADGDPVDVPYFPALGKQPYIHTLPWLVVLAAGVPIYYIWRRFWPESRSPGSATG